MYKVVAKTGLVVVFQLSFAFSFLIGGSGSAIAASASRSIADVSHDLDTYVPAAIQDAGIPGVSIVVIRDGKVALSKAYGVRNVFTKEPVRPDTVFQVASIGKLATAYAALRLVDRHQLVLDHPLADYLPRPWTTAPGGDLITLREVLSHTSGLSNTIWPDDRSLLGPRGRFSYSGVGFVYLQRVIESVRNTSIDQTVSDEEFRPLGMTSAAFGGNIPLKGPVASGHISLGLAELLLAAPASALWLVLLGLESLISRVLAKRWALGWRSIAVAGLISTAVLAGFYSQSPTPEYLMTALPVWLAIVLAGSALVAGACGLFMKIDAGRPAMRWIPAGVALLVLGAGLGISSGMLVPVVPARPFQGNVAFSLCATANDIAKLVVEIMRPRHLGQATDEEMLGTQVHINDQVSWGLGVGLYPGPPRSFSQWGANIGYEGIIVGIPERRSGIVILSNSSGSLPLLRKIAQRTLGVRTNWSIEPPVPLR